MEYVSSVPLICGLAWVWRSETEWRRLEEAVQVETCLTPWRRRHDHVAGVQLRVTLAGLSLRITCCGSGALITSYVRSLSANIIESGDYHKRWLVFKQYTCNSKYVHIRLA